MNVQEPVALGIGFIQGTFFVPFVLTLPQLIMERVMRWKKGSNLPFWGYIITLNGILFFIIAFFGMGWVWIDLLSTNNSNGFYKILAKLWLKGMFCGVLAFYIIALVEEEFRKRKSKKK